MVEQTRAPRRAAPPPRAGPGGDEDMQGDVLDAALRTPGGSVRVMGRQLAVIGDQLHREQTSRHPTGSPSRREAPGFLRGLQSLCRGVKACMASNVSKAFLGSHCCTDGAFLTAALLVLMHLAWSGKPNNNP